MTTSILNASVAPALAEPQPAERPQAAATREHVKRRHTLASRLVFLTISVALVMTTLAYGTVHYWALAAFAISAAAIVCLWAVDGIVLRSVQINLNPIQWPVLGLIVLGVIQLLPLRGAGDSILSISSERALSLDPNSTRLFIIQMTSLLIYFAATLAFTDTPRRLRILVRTITIFGFLLAMFGLTQSFTSDGTRVYWIRQLAQSTAFGPFINRHHFAGYMELALAIPLGLLFSGSVESYKRPLYAFAAGMMGIALIMTTSRGGMLSLAAEIVFLAVIAGPNLKRRQHEEERERGKAKDILLRAGLAAALVIALIGGTVAFGGAGSITRFLGTVNADDPTTGRTHFWGVTLDIIKHSPIIGSGMGSFGVIYTRYDSRNGLYRLEQAHNDYLQTLADGGIIGAVLGLAFLVILFRKGFAARDTRDKFRRGVSTGALAGCFAVLVHSLFDFTLHTTANALLFLVLAALATQDNRVNEASQGNTRKRRRRSHSMTAQPLMRPLPK